MTAGDHFDVLVIGSGASGLAAAVSADRAGARVALATKGSVQSCNSAKAQGGIQAALGEDDSPGRHADDVWRSSHETADRQLVEVLTSEAPAAIHWLEELGVRFTREHGTYRLARCGGATATHRRSSTRSRRGEASRRPTAGPPSISTRRASRSTTPSSRSPTCSGDTGRAESTR